MSTPAPIPWNVSVLQTDPNTGSLLPGFGLSKDFGNWLQTSIVAGVANAPSLYPVVSLTGQNASIASTPIPLPALATGFYRLSYYAEITTADAVSSSLQLTATFTHNSKTLTFSGTAMTGNTTTTIQTNVWTFLIDAASSISYATTYASNTPGSMKYALQILIEAV